jgi:hypothetical protein
MGGIGVCGIRLGLQRGAQICCLFKIPLQSFLLISDKRTWFAFNFLAISVFLAKFEP